MPPARSKTWVKPAAVICSGAVPERFPLRQYTAYVAFLSSVAILVAKSEASMLMFCACARCPLAYSAGVRTSSTIVPGAFMAVEKSLAAICWPVADEAGLLAGGADEQALIAVIAATARAAAAIRRDQDRVESICMLLLQNGESGYQRFRCTAARVSHPPERLRASNPSLRSTRVAR
jgi:hypothetical protein